MRIQHRILRVAPTLCQLVPNRWLSTTNKLSSNQIVTNQHDEQTGITTLSMNRPPVNSLSLELMKSLKSNLEAVSKEKKAVGLVVTSSLETVFCAGLDLTSVYQADKESLREFWGAFQDLWFTLYSYPLPVVAAINGHAPAGGALLCASADHRVMVDGKGKIGLNEAKFGFVAPFWFMDSFKVLVGQNMAERHLKLGTMFKPDEALKMGLVDELASDKSDCLKKSVAMIETFNKVLRPEAVVETKLLCRSEILEKYQQGKLKDLDLATNFMTSDSVQSALGIYVQSLKKK